MKTREKNLYVIGSDLYKNSNIFDNLRDYLEETFKGVIPGRELLIDLVTGDHTQPELTFKQIVQLKHEHEDDFEEAREEDESKATEYILYYFAELTEKQAFWVEHRSDLDIVKVIELIDE